MNESVNKAVFLSYASQDAEAAKKICEALRGAGVEVWFDSDGGLEHGDEWDQKIRRQIKECVLFIPVISASTQARHEGYFRIEWELAAQRAMGIASGVPFILPVVIDETREPGALVPDRFRAVQWTRLRNGEVPADVKQRFLRLWAQRIGPRTEDRGPGTGEIGPRATDHGPRTRSKPWLGLGLATAAAVAIAVLVSRNGFNPKLETPSSKPAPIAAHPLTEARKLVAQARTLFEEGDTANRENFALAEDLLKRALQLDPADGEVWAAQAQLSADVVTYAIDRTDARLAALKSQAERATKLAPDSIEAQIAYASYLARGNQASQEEAIRQMRELTQRAPASRRVLRELGLALAYQSQLEEAFATFEKANAIGGGDPAALLMKAALLLVVADQFEAAEDAIARSLALRANGRAQAVDVLLKLCWRGDLDGAAAALARWPAWLQAEDRGAIVAAEVWLWRREPARAIALLKSFPRDYLTDVYFTGPKSVLLALAYEMAGQPLAAQAEWETVRNVIDRELTADPAKLNALIWKACALAHLGAKAEAEALYRQLEERRELVSWFWTSASPALRLATALGRATAVTPSYYILWGGTRVDGSKAIPQAALRLNPVFDPIRHTPDFQRSLESAPRPNPARPTPDARPGTARLSPAANGAPTAAAIEGKSVAVLAFANLSDEKENEYFSDGISEELLTVLQKIPGLRVAARTSAFSFKGKTATAQEIGQKLGVAHLVEGSVRKAGTSVRITARLSQAATGEQIWSESFTRELKDVFAVQSELAQTIVEQLGSRLGGGLAKTEIQAQVQAAIKGGTRNPEAHQLYLQGKFFANQFSMENLARAAPLFQQAIDRDATFALAWAALGRVSAIRAEYDTTGAAVASGFAQARAAADRALTLEPSLAEGYSARFEVQVGYDFDWRGARETARRALELAPADALVVHNAARLAGFFGELEKAVALGRQAVGLDPVNAEIRGFYAGNLALLKRYAEAEIEHRRALELSPSLPLGHSSIAIEWLRQGRAAEALIEAEKELTDWSRATSLAIIHWALKNTAAADAELARLVASYADVCAYQIAEVHAYRRENDRAFEWLERAYRQRDPGLAFSKNDVELANLHADPRWLVFQRKLGLTDEQLR